MEIFEQSVAELVAALDPGAEVEHNVIQDGRISGVTRQIDVMVSGHLGPSNLKIAIECKRYKRKLGIGAIDEFAGKLQDLGVAHGVLYCTSGYTGPAKARAAQAAQPAIQLELIPSAGPVDVDWGDVLAHFTGFGDCPNENCWTGDIEWQSWTQAEGTDLEGGVCYACGTWAVRCVECDSALGFHWDQVECCGHTYHHISDHDGTETLTYE